MSQTITAYVAAAVTPESSGAFAWRRSLEEAQRALLEIAEVGDDYCLREIPVPMDELDERLIMLGRSDEAVTEYLDDNPELWEPYSGERSSDLNALDIPEGDYRRALEIVASFCNSLSGYDPFKNDAHNNYNEGYARGYQTGQLEFLSDYFGLKPGHTDTESNISQIADEVRLVAERGGIL